MNKLLIALAILVSTITGAEEAFSFNKYSDTNRKEIKYKNDVDDSCGYMAVGGLVPTLTFGGRAFVSNNTFIDGSGSFSTLFVMHQMDLTLRSLTKYRGNKYIGGGLEGALIFNKNISFSGLSVIVTHGWDYPKNFTDVSLGFPLYK